MYNGFSFSAIIQIRFSSGGVVDVDDVDAAFVGVLNSAAINQSLMKLNDD